MRSILLAILVAALSIANVSAIEIKLDDAWIPKLAQLCDAARYGSRMTAEPICNELAAMVTAAQVAENAAKEKAAADKPPPK